MQEIIGTGQLQFLNPVFFDHAADAENADVFQALVIANSMADFAAVDVRKHHVQDDQVGAVFLDHHTGVEAGGGHAHFKAAVLLEDFRHQLDELDVVIDEQHFALAAFQGIGGNTVVLHEFVQGLARDAPEPGTRYPEPLQLSVVETADNGLLADLADFGGLAGRENSFHAFVHPFTGTRPVARVRSPHASPLRRTGDRNRP